MRSINIHFHNFPWHETCIAPEPPSQILPKIIFCSLNVYRGRRFYLPRLKISSLLNCYIEFFDNTTITHAPQEVNPTKEKSEEVLPSPLFWIFQSVLPAIFTKKT